MTWELSDGDQVRGPFGEEDVVAAIGRGLADGTLVRASGEESWRGLRTHPRFAMALEERAAGAARAQSSSSRARSFDWRIGAAIGVVGVLVAVAAILGALARNTASNQPSVVPQIVSVTVPAAVIPAAAPSPRDPAEAEIAQLLKARDLQAAIAATKPQMADTREESSLGALRLGIWAMAHMTWDDLKIARAETRPGLVFKDSDEERGKRFCIGGSIIQIEVDKSKFGKASIGLLMDDSTELIHFIAVGSSGALVKQSPARFCGVVTGLYDYSNSGGGTGHAIDMVGMFDLPENKK